jgi:tRNA pseudouridine38-40 synthase
VTARLLLEYDGGEFAGWAKQPGDLRTVQGVLEDALRVLLRRDVALTVAGRTDAGVHARGQVASHDGDPAPAHRLNGVLPHDVRIVSSEPAPEGFNARFDARSRTYRYRVFTRRATSPFERGRALHYPHGLDASLLRSCAALVAGTHDFTAFTPVQNDHVRFERDVFLAEWREPEEHVLEFWIEADTFMRHMVRILVGSMLAVANGQRDLDWLAGLLSGRPRPDAGDTAPAHGLYLERVTY